MRVFVYEHVCGGGWSHEHVVASLAAEGGAMLRALCEDLARLPQVEVTTTLDARCGLALPAAVRVIGVESAAQANEEMLHQAVLADVTFVIAPELENTLARQV